MIYRMKLADSVDEMTFDLLEVPIEDKDIEGATDNTTIDGNIFTDYLWLKKQFVQKWSLMCKDDYTQLRGFYTRQWENAEAPTYTLFAGQNRSETLTASGSAFRIQNGTQYDAPFTLTELTGNATQNGTPTPDAPIAVQTTTGENVVKITGKNLFDKDNYTVIDGYMRDFANQFVCISGNNNKTIVIPCQPNTTYTVQKTGGNRFTVFTSDALYSANGTYEIQNLVRGTSDASTEPPSQTITSGSSDKYLYVHLTERTTTWPLVDILNTLQIELGSTATTYESYQAQEYEVNLGKNLLENTRITTATTTNGITATPNSDGTISLSGTASALTWFVINNTTSVPAGTYTLSGGMGTGSGVAMYNDAWGGTEIAKTITLASKSTGNWSIRIASGTNTNGMVVKPQLEKGSTATAYAPYFTPIELAKIGTYQDRIYKNDGKWYIYKEIGKVDLSTLTWQNVGGALRKTTGFDNIKYVSSNTELGAIMAEKYTPHIGSGMSATTGCIAVDVSAVSATDASGAPTGLAYYALATPTTTEITDSTLLAQLNFIANLYGGTNNIMLVGTGAQGEIGVEYTLTYEKEQTIIPETTVRLTLTDGGVINTCECRQNVQLTMRETVQ